MERIKKLTENDKNKMKEDWEVAKRIRIINGQ